jgi:hypothetical protein
MPYDNNKKKIAKPKSPVDRAFNIDRGGLNSGRPKSRNGIIKVDPRETSGFGPKRPKPVARKPRAGAANPAMGAILPSRGAPKLRKSNPILRTMPIKKTTTRKKAY